MSMEIYAIVNGNVLPYILDPNFEKYLPIIPSEVSYVNFTWKSGMKKYYYNFDRLQSFDERILEAPVISIKTRGRVPKRPKEFSILLPCLGNSSGIAAFGIGLLIESRKGRPLNGTPLRLKLRKECSQRGNIQFYNIIQDEFIRYCIFPKYFFKCIFGKCENLKAVKINDTSKTIILYKFYRHVKK